MKGHNQGGEDDDDCGELINILLHMRDIFTNCNKLGCNKEIKTSISNIEDIIELLTKTQVTTGKSLEELLSFYKERKEYFILQPKRKERRDKK